MPKKPHLFLLVSLSLAAGFANAEIIDGEELVDPTRPIFFVAGSDGELSDVQEMIRAVIPASYDLSFVRASTNSSMAIINNEQVTVGDVIGGALVVSIDRDGVVLSVNEQERRISLFENSVKAPVNDQ